MDIPFYYWIIGGFLLLCAILFLIRKRQIVMKRIRGFEKRQQFWLQHRNSLAGNFVMTFTDPIEDTYILDKDDALLGRGGYGIVVLGVHKYSNIKYAIKFMNKEKLEKKNSRINRLEREYKLLKDMDHANIVRLFAVYDSVHEMGFVMELCSGGHLGHWLENIKYEPCRVPAEHTVKSIMRQLLSSVAYMHSQGICHRDIKLQNILRESNEPNAQIKLCDFGLGTRFIGALPLKTHCGTLYSTAPEVIRESYDERCDIWSCGVVAFTLLSGRKPFEALVMHPASGETPMGKSSVTANILMGRYHFKNKEWHHRSRLSKEFVKLMMTQDYRVRWHAQEALDHDWFHEMSTDLDKESLPSSRTRSTSKMSEELTDPRQQPNPNKQKDLQPLLANMKRQADSSVLHQAGRLAVAYNMPQSQITDKRRQIFQAFDEDNNGSLSRQEFRKAFKEFGMLNLFDGNHNHRAGENDRDDKKSDCGSTTGDLEDITDNTRKQEEILNLSEKDIDRVFDAVDVNGDNAISFTEFLAATLDPRDFDTVAINTAFGIMDVNKKGYITADDMERVLAVTATARGRRRNSSSKKTASSASGSFYPLVSNDQRGGSPSSSAKISKNEIATPIVRRHHSFTMGVKGGSRKQSLFKQSQRTTTNLSPVHSAVNGESESNCYSKEVHSSGKDSSSATRSGTNKMQNTIENDNESDCNDDYDDDNDEDDVEKQLPKASPTPQPVDNRPGVQRPRAFSSMSFGDFLRRPSLMTNYSQLENLLKERRASSTAFNFVSNLRNKSSTIAPVLVEEGEHSTSEAAKGVPAKNVKGSYDVADLEGSDELYHSEEVVKPTEFTLRAMTSPSLMLSHTNSFGRALSRENSNKENDLNDIDDRTFEQIKRAIKLCDRNNTGVVSYTDFLMAMTGNDYDDTTTPGSGSHNTSRRSSRSRCTSAETFIQPNLSIGNDDIQNHLSVDGDELI